MKTGFLLYGILLLLVSCGSNQTEESDVNNNNLSEQQSWQASLDDSSGNIVLNRNGAPLPDTLSIDAIKAFLNSRYPNIQLQVLRQSGDTLYVQIPEATYLTQQMGSTGPEMYFGEAVYNLTEIPGIRFINFALAEGDHAGPDTYNRDSFKPE
ncbi:MAG: hypothetical protein KAX45_08425 [Chitinophagaceae bacterium]|nr:hypothetical protein [Chitinophagaceae bacterium]MBP8244549.1 hypothetical protein [Chitinophagaceae bacterium]